MKVSAGASSSARRSTRKNVEEEEEEKRGRRDTKTSEKVDFLKISFIFQVTSLMISIVLNPGEESTRSSQCFRCVLCPVHRSLIFLVLQTSRKRHLSNASTITTDLESEFVQEFDLDENNLLPSWHPSSTLDLMDLDKKWLILYLYDSE